MDIEGCLDPDRCYFLSLFLADEGKFIFLTFSNKFCFKIQQNTAIVPIVLPHFITNQVHERTHFEAGMSFVLQRIVSGCFLRTDFSPNIVSGCFLRTDFSPNIVSGCLLRTDFSPIISFTFHKKPRGCLIVIAIFNVIFHTVWCSLYDIAKNMI